MGLLDEGEVPPAPDWANSNTWELAWVFNKIYDRWSRETGYETDGPDVDKLNMCLESWQRTVVESMHELLESEWFERYTVMVAVKTMDEFGQMIQDGTQSVLGKDDIMEIIEEQTRDYR